MRIKVVLLACLWSLSFGVKAQTKDPSPEVVKRLESVLNRFCLEIKNGIPWTDMETSKAATICSCAVPNTMPHAISNRNQEGNTVGKILALNFFKCGRVDIQEQWISHLKKERKELNRAQLLCFANLKYQMYINYFEYGTPVSLEDVHRQTASCF